MLTSIRAGDDPTGESQRVRYRSDVYSSGTKWWPSGKLCITLYRPRSAQHRRGAHGGWYLGCLPAANRIEDDGPSAALRSCVASTMSHGPTLAAGALGETVLGRQVSVKVSVTSEVSFSVSG